MMGDRLGQSVAGTIALCCFALVAMLSTSGCAPKISIKTVPAALIEQEEGMHAGAAQVDITPPLGAPLLGYAIGSAAQRALGYRTRLMARTIVLQGKEGGRFALIQCDLSSISHLLHHRVAAKVAKLGISSDRLLIAASHTHAGPGGYFGNTFYNFFGSGTPGFDEQVLAFLSERLVKSIADSVAGMGPAALSFGTRHLPGVTYNRSFPAWQNNQADDLRGEHTPHVDDRIYMLRVDRELRGRTEPLAAFAIFAVHGTTVSMKNDLYHGDVHGYASRQFAGRVGFQFPQATQAFVAAFANGAEGDASAVKDSQGFATSEKIGSRIGDEAYLLYSELNETLRSDLDLSHAYREQPMSGAITSEGEVCLDAKIGVATLAGAEDGPSSNTGKFGIREGRKKSDAEGCHSYKVTALGFLQNFAIRPFRDATHFGTIPNIAPFQTLMIHPSTTSSLESSGAPDSIAANEPVVVFGTVPGEPTSVVGERVASQIAQVFGANFPRERVAVVGLANSYLGYFTTPAEYRAQHYEGSSTFFGPLQSILAIEQLTAITERTRDEVLRREGRSLGTASARVLQYEIMKFRPGTRASFIGTDVDCEKDAADWEAGDAPTFSDSGDYLRVEYQWTGLSTGVACSPPTIRVTCEGEALRDVFGQEETDAGTRFEVRRLPAMFTENQWRLYFFAHGSQLGKTDCRFEIERPGHQALLSPEFDLKRGTP